MGCNAWNHPPGCNCGWGGDRGGGGWPSQEVVPARTAGVGDYAARAEHSNPAHKSPLILDPGVWIKSKEKRRNANCPVCWKAVYFVQADNGGRVFFDELGPPWPKHPCTDNAQAKGSQVVAYGGQRPGACERTAVTASDWYLLQDPRIELKDNYWHIEGFCRELKRYLRLRASEACINTPIPPVLVTEEGDSGAYWCSFVTKEAIALRHPALTSLFVSTISGPAVDTWNAALQGRSTAANAIGWAHSFFWDDVEDGERFKTHRVAEYWFRKAAERGSPEGENNYGVYKLRGGNGDPDLQEAWKYLLRGSFRMCSTSYGHLGSMLLDGFQDFNPTDLGLLLKAVGRQLTFQDLQSRVFEGGDDDDPTSLEVGVATEGSEFRYSPYDIAAYSYFETALNVAKLADPLPAWNLVWLSVQGLELPLRDGCVVEWHRSVNVPSGLLETMLFDLDDNLTEKVTLREALRMHPRRFLHYFESADTRHLTVERRSPDWKKRVIFRAKEADERMPE